MERHWHAISTPKAAEGRLRVGKRPQVLFQETSIKQGRCECDKHLSTRIGRSRTVRFGCTPTGEYVTHQVLWIGNVGTGVYFARATGVVPCI